MVQDSLRKEKVQNVFFQNGRLVHLESVFNHYSAVSDKPTATGDAVKQDAVSDTAHMNLEEFTLVLVDCGLFKIPDKEQKERTKTIRLSSGKEILTDASGIVRGRRTPQSHTNSLSLQDVRVAFTRSQQISDNTTEERNTMVKSRFIHACVISYTHL